MTPTEPNLNAESVVVMGYAYQPRHGPMSVSRYHVVLTQPLDAGRLHRAAGDALCRPRSRFDYLDIRTPGEEGRWFNCPRCLDLAERHGVLLIDGSPGGESVGS